MTVSIGDVFNATTKRLIYKNSASSVEFFLDPAPSDTGALDVPIKNFLGYPDFVPTENQGYIYIEFENIVVGRFYQYDGDIYYEKPIDGEPDQWPDGQKVASGEEGKKYSFGWQLNDGKAQLDLYEYKDGGYVIKTFSDLLTWAASNLSTLITDIVL